MISQYGRGKVLVGGSEIFALDEWVVKIDLFANRLTYWQVGWPIQQVQPIGQRVRIQNPSARVRFHPRRDRFSPRPHIAGYAHPNRNH